MSRVLSRLRTTARHDTHSVLCWSQVLFPALQALRSHASFVAPTIHEPFLRRYQVLPGRCHPEMQGMASGGMILSCIRVLENDDAQAISVARRGKKRPAAATGGADAPQGGATEATSATASAAKEAGGGPERKRAKVVGEGEVSQEGGSTTGAADVVVDPTGGTDMQVDSTGAEA